MSEHLSGPEISAWVAGERTPQSDGHMAACTECQARAVRLERAVDWFRGSIHAWSSLPAPSARRRSLPAPARWTLVAATLVILAGVPIYRNVERQRAAEQARADSLLLEQVNASLSRPVPAPLEPLLNLVSGESQ